MEFTDLKTVVNFLYLGEANIYQENLETFLDIAEELKLKGLNRECSNTTQNNPNLMENCADESVAQESEIVGNQPLKSPNLNYIKHKKLSLNSQVENSVKYEDSEMAVALPNQDVLGELQDLDQKVMSMMVLGHNMIAKGNGKQRASICQVCGKEGQTSLIKDHIEANHLDGITIPCNLCEKTFR